MQKIKQANKQTKQIQTYYLQQEVSISTNLGFQDHENLIIVQLIHKLRVS